MRLLVVDDDTLLLPVLEMSLVDAGYDVAVAGNGREALDVLRNQDVDLLITDISMPVMDGLALIQALRASTSHLPILAISGGGRGSDKDVLAKARRLGANATLAKPFIPDDLILLIEKLRGTDAAPAV